MFRVSAIEYRIGCTEGNFVSNRGALVQVGLPSAWWEIAPQFYTTASRDVRKLKTTVGRIASILQVNTLCCLKFTFRPFQPLGGGCGVISQVRRDVTVQATSVELHSEILDQTWFYPCHATAPPSWCRKKDYFTFTH